MKKRITAFLLALCMALALLPGAALAAEPGGVPEDREWTDTPEEDTGPELMAEPGWVSYPVTGGNLWFDPATGMIMDCTYYVTSVEIPSSIGEVPVTGIGRQAFGGRPYLTKVTVPDSVTTIQSAAFFDSAALTSVTIPGSVTSAGDSLFEGCTQLKTAGPIGSGCNIEFGWSSEIPERVFMGCTGLQRVILPDTITQIGEYAFGNCGNLAEINLPSGLTRIEGGLFLNCGSLSEITIPVRVASIGDHAFSNCTNLNHITIPAGVTEIDRYAFQKCTSLTSAGPAGSGCSIEFGWTGEIPRYAFYEIEALASVTIPDSITRINDHVFYGCSGLESISIPDSVTWIGASVFWGCEGLESITFPASVQVLNESAIRWCSNLRYVSILNSDIRISSSGNFQNCENLTDIYFNGNKDAWEGQNKWLDLPESVTLHFNSRGPNDLDSVTTEITGGQYVLHIVDPGGNSLPGAAVQFGGTSKAADEDGLVRFDLADEALPGITVILSGYAAWTRLGGGTPLPEHYETIVLQPLTSQAPGTLDTCRFSENQNMTSAVDLLTRAQTVVLGENDDKAFYLSCAASVKEGASGTVSRYELRQSGKKIAESTNGSFTLYPRDFQTGGCTIRVHAGDASWDTGINLRFKAPDLTGFPENVDFGNSISQIAVPESVPLLGGSTLALNFARYFPVTVTVSDGKICMGVNFNDVKDEASIKEQMKQAKKLMRYAKRSCQLMGKGTALSAQDQKIYNSLIKGKEKNLSKADWEFNVLGYLEGDLGGSTLSGTLILQIKSPSAKFKYNTWVSVVPVTVQVGIGAAGNLTGSISYNWKQNQLSGSLELGISGSIHFFGGVGVDEYVAVGAYGEPQLKLDIHILKTPMNLTYLGLTGSMGLEAYFAGQKLTVPLWDAKEGIQIWPRKESTASLFSDGEDWYDPENWELQDLSYLEEESAWLGDGVSLYDAGASTALTPLLRGTYRDARPVLVSGEDGLYAAFLQADANTGDIYTAVTKYTGTKWLDPVRVDENAVLDSAPVLLSDGENIWLAYGRTADPTFDKESMSSYAQSQSIVVGKLNSETLTLTNRMEYPGGGDFSHLQTLGLVKGVPTLAWVESGVTDDNSVLRPDSGRIYTASCNGGAWGEAVLVETVDGPVTQVVAGDTGVAYVSNGTLYQAGDGSKVLAENVQGRVTFGQAADMKDPDFLWNGDDCLETASGTSIPAAGITREYALSGNRIYYSAPDEKGAHLTAVLYEGGTWSAPITLTGGERYLENLSVVSWKGNSWLMGMDTTAQITGDGVEASKDLVWAEIQPSSDLRLDGVSFEEEGMTPGEPVNVTLYVTNAGDHTVSSGNLKVTLNGNFWTPDSNSLTSLAPGESAELTGSITCPSEPTEYTFAVAETGKDDFTPNDNRFDTSLGHARLSVALSEQKIGDSRALYALVSNDGIATSAPGSVLFCNGAGTVLEEASFQALAPGDSAVILCTGDLYGDYTATLSSTSAGDVFGDMDTVFIDGTPGTVRSVTRSGSSVTAEISARRNGTAYCAFYGENQRLLDVREAAFTEKTRKLDFSGPAEFSKAKVFLTDGTGTPLCPAKSTP